jgi:hypothetical protein
MTKLSDLLVTKKEAIDKLLARVMTVKERFEQIWQANQVPEITNPLADAIQTIKQMRVTADTPPFELGAAIGACDQSFARIATVLARFNPSETKSDVSPTFLITTAQEIGSFEAYHAIYLANGTSEAIYELIIPILMKKKLADVEAAYAAHPSGITLYAMYLQTAIDAEAPGAIDALERAKTASLLSPGHAPLPTYDCDHWPMQRFGLMPVKRHMTEAELISFYFGGRSKTGANFVSVARAHKTSVIMLTYSTQNPVEYDISKLIDPVAAKGFIIPAAAGVNLAMLNRFALIRRELADAARSCSFALTRHEAGPRWIIVRSLDGGTHWDAMAESVAQLTVDTRVADALTRGPSPRIDAANALVNTSFAAAFRRVPDVIDDIKADNKPLVNSLIGQITGRIVQYIDKKVVTAPAKQSEFEAIVNDPEIVAIMSDELLKSYAQCGISADAPPEEYLGSFIADAERDIIVQFARNLRLNTIELGPKPELWRDYSGPTLRTRLYNIFVDIIKRSVSSSLLRKESVYDKILIKDALLRAATDARRVGATSAFQS